MSTCNKHGEPITYTAEKCPACEHRKQMLLHLSINPKVQQYSKEQIYTALLGANDIIKDAMEELAKRDKIIELMAKDIWRLLYQFGIKNYTQSGKEQISPQALIKRFTAQAEEELADET